MAQIFITFEQLESIFAQLPSIVITKDQLGTIDQLPQITLATHQLKNVITQLRPHDTPTKKIDIPPVVDNIECPVCFDTKPVFQFTHCDACRNGVCTECLVKCTKCPICRADNPLTQSVPTLAATAPLSAIRRRNQRLTAAFGSVSDSLDESPPIRRITDSRQIRPAVRRQTRRPVTDSSDESITIRRRPTNVADSSDESPAVRRHRLCGHRRHERRYNDLYPSDSSDCDECSETRVTRVNVHTFTKCQAIRNNARPCKQTTNLSDDGYCKYHNSVKFKR